MAKLKILLVDDAPDILEILEFHLAKAGYEMHKANDGIEGMIAAEGFKPDMIVLDMMMPKMNGLEVCKALRQKNAFSETIIIMLTAVVDEKTEVSCLDAGADDYLTKPISPALLLSKIQSLTRRKPTVVQNSMHLGKLVIDSDKYMVRYGEQDVVLARKEFELLKLLASRPGKVFLRNDILQQVWGTEVIVGDRTIDVHVRKIRQKLHVDCICTVKGVGYKFILPEEDAIADTV